MSGFDIAAYRRTLREIVKQGLTRHELYGVAKRYCDRESARRPRKGPPRDRVSAGGQARARERQGHPPEFVTLDGEGLTRADGQHDYTLLASSLGTYIEQYDLGGLGTKQCLEFVLATQQASPHARLAAFAFGYDTNMMLRDFTPDQLERLALGEYVTWRQGGAYYRLRYIPGKSLYVARGQWSRQRWEPELTARVWDVFGFYQRSFVRALDEWKIGTSQEVKRIAAMKGQRGAFTRRQRDRIRSYCLDECRLLVELLDTLARVLWDAEIKPQRWDGAGAVAAALMREHEIKAAIVRPEDAGLSDENASKLADAQMCAYFGGRVERFVAGRVPGPVYTYDINSAYPAQIAGLPSLHGRWRHRRAYDPAARWALWFVRWSNPTASVLAPFPFREKRHIQWPTRGAGWYHGCELAAAMDCVPGRYDVIEGWTFEPETDARPFAWVAGKYLERRAYKEVGDARHIVLKLGLNSLYGKLAQGVSGGDNLPPYQSYYLAGRVTAGCRSEMLRAAAQARPDELVSIATDGLYVTAPLALPVGPELGEWEAGTIEPGLLVVQAGVMVSPSRTYLKTRGSAAGAVEYDALLAAWKRDGFYASVAAHETRFIGAAYAVHVGKLDQWRRWVAMERALTFNPTPRKWPEQRAWGRHRMLEHLRPPRMDAGQVSEVYVPKSRADIDEALDELRLLMEQPDIDA